MKSLGFFDEEAIRKTAPILLPRCGLCKLNLGCRSPKMPVSGKGLKEILIVGEAPGASEDEQNKQFVGKTGKFLQDTLWGLGVDLRRDCWLTNSLICRPPSNTIPDKRIVDWCRPNLINTIKELKPKIILLLGAVPVRSLIGWLWKEDPGGINRWAGYNIPSRRLNAWVSPAWHPSFVTRLQDDPRDGGVAELVWKRHLKAALSKKDRPWNEGDPDISSSVRAILDPTKAAEAIHELMSSGKPLAFDIETNGIKPDASCMRIYCCSVSDGETSIAYPWHGAVIEATKELITSNTPKIGFNDKYEARWMKKHLGVWVKNVIWDGMLAAHVLDNRPGTKSLKFQAFALLGEESYDDFVKPYFKSTGTNEPNRIADVPLPTLLKYCAMDSLLEVRVARVQAKKLGVKL